MEFDPHAWSQAAAQLKTGFDMFRSAIGLYKDIRPGTATPEQAKAIAAALDKAETAATVAEAEIAKALGYELCRRHYPPVIMLTVGYFDSPDEGHKAGDPVFKCPQCGHDTAGPWMYTRSAAPERSSASDDDHLRDAEVALMDAIRTILEVIVAKNISSPETLVKALEHQRQAYSPEDMPRARFVMDLLCATLADPARKDFREQLRRILQEPPAGSA
jgi:hypothetical protein